MVGMTHFQDAGEPRAPSYFTVAAAFSFLVWGREMSLWTHTFPSKNGSVLTLR